MDLNQKIENVLDAITELVDDHMNWKAKLKEIQQAAKENERWRTALEEFSFWFETDEE